MSKNNNNRKKPTEHERISREARIDRTIREYLTALRNFVDHKNKLAADCEFYDLTKKLRQYCRKHWDAIDVQTKSFFEEEIPLIIDSELFYLAEDLREHMDKLRKLNLPRSIDVEEELDLVKHAVYESGGEVTPEDMENYLNSLLEDYDPADNKTRGGKK